MQIMSNTFTQTLTVTKDHIDEHNHVNNLVYLQWCLDVAQAHWDAYATAAIKANYVWYVVNHNINYKAAAFEGDLLEVQTVVKSVAGVRSTRAYKIVRPKDGKILIEATTLWCLMDAKTVRATAITDEIRNLFF